MITSSEMTGVSPTLSCQEQTISCVGLRVCSKSRENLYLTCSFTDLKDQESQSYMSRFLCWYHGEWSEQTPLWVLQVHSMVNWNMVYSASLKKPICGEVNPRIIESRIGSRVDSYSFIVSNVHRTVWITQRTGYNAVMRLLPAQSFQVIPESQ